MTPAASAPQRWSWPATATVAPAGSPVARAAAGVYADVPTAQAALRYDRTLIEPVADQVPIYDAIFRDVYRRFYPAVAPLSHAIAGLSTTSGVPPG